MNAPIEIKKITSAAITEKLSLSLRRIVGPGRRWSYAEVSGRTGIDMRTLRAYVQGTACPNLVRYKRLLAVLGPEIGQELNTMQGMLPRRDASPPEALDLAAFGRELERAAGILASALGQAVPERPMNAVPPGRRDTRQDAAEREEILTRPDFRAALKVTRIDRNAIVSRFSYRLRCMIGPDRQWSESAVAAATGIDVRTLRSYIDGSACPNLTRYLRLVQLLGSEIGFELALMLGWQPRYRAPSRLSKTSLQPLQHAIEDALEAIEAIRGTDRDPQLIMPDDRLKDDVCPPERLRKPVAIVADAIVHTKREPELSR